ncbi:MAG: 4Fe-4S dicluster domain-containing protein [Spirochaetota bacterium]
MQESREASRTEARLLTDGNLARLLIALQDKYQVFIPRKKNGQRFYARFTPPEIIGEGMFERSGYCIGEVRAFEPLKAFFTRAREKVSEDFAPDIPEGPGKPFCIVGVKACDLKGFRVQDHVFQDHDFPDPLYLRSRQQNLIISADCTTAIDTCFCAALDVKPYPREGFDLNLSYTGGGWVVQAGSEKGSALLREHGALFEEAGEELLREVAQQRAGVTHQVESNVDQHRVPRQEELEGVVEKNFNSGLWSEEAETCVECGACNTICPTCHCFLLFDQKREDVMQRLRVWDSCLIKDFAKVAAGVNPRPRLWMRLRNRFEKKFDFFPRVAGVYACTGCGRCISACPAKIDIREVLQRLVSDARKQPV